MQEEAGKNKGLAGPEGQTVLPLGFEAIGTNRATELSYSPLQMKGQARQRIQGEEAK